MNVNAKLVNDGWTWHFLQCAMEGHETAGAVVGAVLFFSGEGSTVATRVLRDEVWIISGIAALIGIFLMTHAWIPRSTDMG